MPSNYTKNELVSLFSPFGQILSAKVMIDLQTGHSKCFGFVRFASLSSASNAVLVMDGFVVNENKRLLCRFAATQKENTGEDKHNIHEEFMLSLHNERYLEYIFEVWNNYWNQNDPKSLKKQTIINLQ